MINKEQEERYELTPKGFLIYELVEKGLTYKQAEEIWNSLHAFVARQAIQYKYKKGLPTLIFDQRGGTYIRVMEEKQ